MKKRRQWLALPVLLLLAAGLTLLLNARSDAEKASGPVSSALEKLTGTKAPQLELKLLGEEELTLEYGEDFSDPGAEAWLVDAEGGRKKLEILVSPAFDPETLGTTELSYSAVEAGQTLGTVSRRVTVRDTLPPEITLLGAPGERDFSAWDRRDGDLSDKVQRREEADRFVYTVSDSSGNEAEAVRQKAPVLLLEGGGNVSVTANYRFFDPGFTAVDMYGRDLSERVQIEGEITPWRPGSYELSYTLTDDFGQTVSAKRSVEIVAAELPETVLEEKVIYLSFDDGPAGPTEELLDMLAKYDAKVTFFVTYTDPRYVDMIGRAYREGHSIGVHAYAHDASRIYVSEEAYFEYFDLMEEIIYEQTGEYTNIVRFVGGSSNASSMYFSDGIMTRLAEDLTNMGYRYYDWNIQPENEECDIAAASGNIIGVSMQICEEGETVPISLQHDTGAWNIYVAERVIKWGLEHGYTFKGIDLTTPEVHHLIRN